MWASARLGSLWDTEIRVLWLTPVAILIGSIWALTIYGWAFEVLWLGVGSVVVALGLGVLLHEMGHVLAARCFGLPADEILLHPFGGFAIIGAEARTPRAEFLVAFAGPAVNIVLFVLGMLTYRLLGGDFELALVWPLVASDMASGLFQTSALLFFLHTFVSIQALLALFNLALVAYPMDGGRMLFALTWARRGRAEGMLLCLELGRVIGAIGIGAGLWHHMAVLIVLGVVVWLMSHGMLRRGHAQRSHEPSLAQSSAPLSEWEPQPDPPTPAKSRHRIRKAGPIRRLLVRWRARKMIASAQKIVDDRQRVDLLLDKINADGIEALSVEERSFLEQASKEHFSSTSTDESH